MTSEIKPLTGFRGIAALLVMMYHFGHSLDQPELAKTFSIPKGYLAVDAFFMLSGFVLSYSHQRFATSLSRQDWLDFMIRRLVRLYPVYYAVLLLTALKLTGLPVDIAWLTGLSGKDWFGNLAMAYGWGMTFKPLVGISWSASAELFCYVCFPLVLRRMHLGLSHIWLQSRPWPLRDSSSTHGTSPE